MGLQKGCFSKGNVKVNIYLQWCVLLLGIHPSIFLLDWDCLHTPLKRAFIGVESLKKDNGVNQTNLDYFSFRTAGIVNQGKSATSGNNTVSATGFVYTVTLNTTRANANYLVNVQPEVGGGDGCMYCEVRSKSTTGFVVELKTCANAVPTGKNPTINVTMYA